MRTSIYAAMALIGYPSLLGAFPYVGFYQTVDDVSNAPKSIVGLYSYGSGDDEKLAGRVLALYDKNGEIIETIAQPVKIAEKVPGKPFYAGMDIIWGMNWNAKADKFEGGKIMDPTSGKVYSSVIWSENGKLNVRGKIGPFGRTQIWNALPVDKLPAALRNQDMKNWEPVIRK